MQPIQSPPVNGGGCFFVTAQPKPSVNHQTVLSLLCQRGTTHSEGFIANDDDERYRCYRQPTYH